MFKKKGNCSTIKDVIKRNHPDINDFLFPEKEPEIKNLREAADYLKKLTTEDPECLVTIVGDYDVDALRIWSCPIRKNTSPYFRRVWLIRKDY